MRSARAEGRLLLAIACLWAAGAGAAELGTLFHTPQERERLERLRRGETAPDGGAHGRAITGYVKRSDGRATVWIDGVPVQLPAGRAGRALEPGAVRGYAGRDDDDLKVERKR